MNTTPSLPAGLPGSFYAHKTDASRGLFYSLTDARLTGSMAAHPTAGTVAHASAGDCLAAHFPSLYRWLTIDEVKRIMGLPAGYDLGDTKTNAGEGLGQGCEVSSFTQLIKSITRTA